VIVQGVKRAKAMPAAAENAEIEQNVNPRLTSSWRQEKTNTFARLTVSMG